jgi:hypothetical protein
MSHGALPWYIDSNVSYAFRKKAAPSGAHYDDLSG